MNHPIEEKIINSPFEDNQKIWLRSFAEYLLNTKFSDSCQCNKESLPFTMATFTYLSEDKLRCVRCKKLKEQ
jgi:hypothetical protein